MKIIYRLKWAMLGAAPVALCLWALGTWARAPQSRTVIPLSPVSTSVLVSQAVHQGLIQPFGPAAKPSHGLSLACSPAPCVLPPLQLSEGGSPVNETPVANNPTNSTQLVAGANDYNCSAVQGVYNSGDTGSTWSHTCINTLSGLFGEGDPGVGYDLHGNSYFSGIDANSTLTFGEIIYEKSANNGVTWSSPKVAVKPLLSGLTDKDWLQIDTNPKSPFASALYISTTQFNSSFTLTEVSVSHSTNGGSTWTTVAVSSQATAPAVNEFSDLGIAKDGTVYLTWMFCPGTGSAGDCGGTTATLMFSKSTDGGNTWSTPSAITTANLAPDSCVCAYYGNLPNTDERVSEIPAIGVDNSTGPHAGNLYVVYYNWSGTQMRVFVTTSTNGGTSWSKGVPVAPSTETHDQFFPWLSVSHRGIVGVSWLDRRNDPSNVSYEAFATISPTGGVNFFPDVQLTTALSNPFNDGFGGFFLGDYTGNTWDGNTLFATWTDTSNGVDDQDEVGGYLP